MLKLKSKNCSNHRSLPLHLQYLRLKKKIQRRLKESQNLILSMVILFLVLTILLLVVSLP
jgi:lipopolysaccharide/colanic/teichoic acid biosynthesis glycosyltransferase